MASGVQIENIEAMRRREGIDDVELREEIRGLAVGDLVMLTFLTGMRSPAAETLLVRITRISDGVFHGKLAGRPASLGLSELRVGSAVHFMTAHIHSIPKTQSTSGN
jgi:hypothetical protein